MPGIGSADDLDRFGGEERTGREGGKRNSLCSSSSLSSSSSSDSSSAPRPRFRFSRSFSLIMGLSASGMRIPDSLTWDLCVWGGRGRRGEAKEQSRWERQSKSKRKEFAPSDEYVEKARKRKSPT